MKKIILTALTAAFLLLACALFAEDKIRVVVEGIEDAKANTSTIHIATGTEAEEMRAKVMASSSQKMEKEVLDALIVKVINLEDELKKSKKTEVLILIIIVIETFLMLGIILFLRKK